ncbi:MAG: 16S rRNA (cytosine(1402)-N(4))-methyltransferase RsmH [Patescibacteria group bacterium]
MFGRVKKLYAFLDKNLSHISVLRQPVSDFLNLHAGDLMIDGTLGLAGHACDALRAMGSTGHLYCFDQDENHLAFARDRLLQISSNFTLFHANFSEMQERLASVGVSQVNGILLDLGLASPHIDDPERGFSFLRDGPLDMRFSPELTPATAADIVNTWSVADLQTIFWRYGEEKFARRIVQGIVDYREEKPFTRTKELADLIVQVTPRLYHVKVHPATRVFQALRIAVNRELEVLENVLPQAVSLLAKGGRLVIISYHSLEDRIVKHFLKSQAAECICPPEVLRCVCPGTPILKLVTKKPIEPSEEEISQNPRSRSAKMRVAEKF